MDNLHVIYLALIQSKITYVLPAFAGQLSVMDLARFDALARKAKRRGLAKTMPTMQQTIDIIGNLLFKRMQNPAHCLHHLLPPLRLNTVGRLRSRGHP